MLLKKPILGYQKGTERKTFMETTAASKKWVPGPHYNMEIDWKK
jgi:hypothetical protein